MVTTVARRWRRTRPHCGGWWLYREDGFSTYQQVLLVADGSKVASDDEWEQATGKPPDDVLCENYWAGTPTDAESMPGLWKQE